MDPRIKVIYIRELNRFDTVERQPIPSRLKEWPGHVNYSNKEILHVLKMGIRWYCG